MVCRAQYLQAQCPVKASADKLIVQCGDTVHLKAFVEPQDYVINNDFNTPAKQPGTGWEQSPSATYTNPCGNPPAGGQTYMWMGNGADVPRILSTTAFDLSTGGYIKFDLKYAVQGISAPCEGPDLPEEGVFLQYSVNNAPWQTIKYFDTKDGTDPIMTNWNTYQFNIPLAACKPNTRIRWIQTKSSGINYDNWGIDNVQIVRNSPNYLFDWLQDPYDPSQTGNTPGVQPYSDSTYTVRYYNKFDPSDTCSASIHVQTIMPDATLSANVNTACSNQDVQLLIDPVFYPFNPQSCGTGASNCSNGNSSDFSIGINPIIEPGNGHYNPLGTIPTIACTCSGGIGNCDKSYKTQFIISKSEFPSYFRGGQFSSLSFTVENLGSSSSYSNFTIKMGCTALEKFTSSSEYVTSLYTVYSGTRTLSNGVNNIFFNTMFNWSGDDNIVVEISWSSTGYRSGNITKMQTLENQAMTVRGCQSNSFDDLTNATIYRYRPIIKLHACYYPVQAISYAWTPSNLLDNPNIPNPVAQIDASTTFKVKAQISTKPQCAVEKQITIQHKNPSLSISTPKTTICDYMDSVQLTAVASSSTVNGIISSYTWSPNQHINNPNSSNPVVKPTQQTYYKCKATDQMGCTIEDSVLIKVQGTIKPYLSTNAPICSGETLKVQTPFIQNAQYLWSGPNAYTGTTSILNFPNSDSSLNGYYYCAVTYKGCKGKKDSILAQINTKIDPIIQYSNAVYCKSANNPVPYKNINGTFSSFPNGLVFTNTNTGEIHLTNSQAGKYTITFTPNDTLCTQAIAIPLQIISNYDPSFSYPSPICEGTALTFPSLTDTSLNYFTVVGGDSTQVNFLSRKRGIIDIKNASPGTYTIKNNIQAGTGCSNTSSNSSFTIVARPNANWTGLTDKSSFCRSDSINIQLSPTQSGGNFNGIGINATVFSPYKLNVDSSIVIYTIKNSSNCQASSSKTIYIKPDPQPNIVGKSDVCLNTPFQLSSSIQADQYYWNGIKGTPSISGYISDTTQFELKVFNQYNCSGKSNITLYPLELPNDSIYGLDSMCAGQVLLFNSTGKYQCLWTPGNTSDDVFAFNGNSSTLLSLISTTAKGCKDTSYKYITVSAIPEVQVSTIPNFCIYDEALILNYGSPIGGIYTINNIETTQLSPEVLGAGLHKLSYAYTNKNNCSNAVSQHFTIYPKPPTPFASLGGNNCEQDSILLKTISLPNTSYQWDGPAFQLNPELENTSAEILLKGLTQEHQGVYTVVIYQNQCKSDNDSIHLTIKYSPSIVANPTQAEICEDSILYLNALNTNSIQISSWEWRDLKYPNTVIDRKAVFKLRNPRSSIYQVKGISPENCSDVAYVELKVLEYPIVDLNPYYQICVGDSLTLVPGIKNQSYIYEWFSTKRFDNDFVFNPTIKSLYTDTFQVKLVAENKQCISEVSSYIYVIDCETNPNISISNAFSPNGDGINDTFSPLVEKVNNYNLMIFNRWGTKLFESSTPNEGWDGKSDGEAVQDDVYVYLLTGIGLDGSSIRRTGTITVIK
jgi:gliding motility-associated-like protein